MRHTTRVRAQLARYLLGHRNDELRRRIEILRETPYPPGSHSLAASKEWQELQQLFPDQRALIYGSAENAIVFSYEASTNALSILFAIIDGRIVGRDE